MDTENNQAPDSVAQASVKMRPSVSSITITVANQLLNRQARWMEVTCFSTEQNLCSTEASEPNEREMIRGMKKGDTDDGATNHGVRTVNSTDDLLSNTANFNPSHTDNTLLLTAENTSAQSRLSSTRSDTVYSDDAPDRPSQLRYIPEDRQHIIAITDHRDYHNRRIVEVVEYDNIVLDTDPSQRILRFAVFNPLKAGFMRRGHQALLIGSIHTAVRYTRNHGVNRLRPFCSIIEAWTIGRDQFPIILLVDTYLIHASFTPEESPDLLFRGSRTGYHIEPTFFSHRSSVVRGIHPDAYLPLPDHYPSSSDEDEAHDDGDGDGIMYDIPDPVAVLNEWIETVEREIYG
ncbi:hypothetical protein B0H10DRAFT_1939209 [Mycena sp. CBHHK59/15]|nr:hypothetical protein B0H10DRAFT_1939209 [Mycena sp. CBHHK59/15]